MKVNGELVLLYKLCACSEQWREGCLGLSSVLLPTSLGLDDPRRMAALLHEPQITSLSSDGTDKKENHVPESSLSDCVNSC